LNREVSIMTGGYDHRGELSLKKGISYLAISPLALHQSRTISLPVGAPA